jgi:predicted Zn-dependent protease with MMP-like domain
MTDHLSRNAASDADARLADYLSTMWEAYRLDEAASGVTAGRSAVLAFPHQGEVWFWLACCLERNKDLRGADHCFLMASKTTIDPQPLPFRVGWRHFQHAVETAGDSMPEKLRAALEEVTLILSDYADPELLEGFDEPEILGLFAGRERADTDEESGGDVSPRIHIFRRAHEHHCTSRVEFDAEVGRTLYRELGHFLGFDEDQLDELGQP